MIEFNNSMCASGGDKICWIISNAIEARIYVNESQQL